MSPSGINVKSSDILTGILLYIQLKRVCHILENFSTDEKKMYVKQKVLGTRY